MQLTYKFKPKLSLIQTAIIEELSFHTTKLYNTANYDCITNRFKTYVDMEKLHKSNWHREFLHSHNYQHCLKILEQNWKSYFKSIADFKKNPSKYNGIPMPPKYKNINNKKNEVIFTAAGIRFKDGILMLSLSKAMQLKHGVKSLNFEVCNKLQSLFDWNCLQQAKIKWNHSLGQWEINIVRRQEVQQLPAHFTNVMAVDLGLDNLATATFLEDDDAYIMNGRPLKSINCYTNREISRLQSIAMTMTGSKKHKDTKAIKRLRRYRDNFTKDYLHKASKQLVDYAVNHHCKTIVIGDISNIKQGNNTKNFVQSPVQKFSTMVAYKAALKGIELVFQKEAYTSGCSALDLEPISLASYNKKRRIHRGLFQSSYGFINADVNGSLNILRLHTKDTCIPKLIVSVRGKGYVNNPVKQRVA